jgi:hypothetical protein
MTIDLLTKNLETNEDRGWIERANTNLFKLATSELRLRTAHTALVWVKEHNREEGNEAADELGNAGANKEGGDWLNLTGKRGINPRGVKLQVLTRSLAYQVIRKRKEKSIEDHLSMERNLELTRKALEEVLGNQPTEEKI